MSASLNFHILPLSPSETHIIPYFINQLFVYTTQLEQNIWGTQTKNRGTGVRRAHAHRVETPDGATQKRIDDADKDDKPANHAVEAEVLLSEGLQHPSRREQPTDQRKQRPPIGGHDVQKYALVRCHQLSLNISNKLRHKSDENPCYLLILFSMPHLIQSQCLSSRNLLNLFSLNYLLSFMRKYFQHTHTTQSTHSGKTKLF